MMPKWKLKDCPRCGGDIFMDIDENGWLGHCLQCGYVGKNPNSVPQTDMAGGGGLLGPDIGSRLVKGLYFAQK